MKKFISILLTSLILVSTFFSFNAFANTVTDVNDSAPAPELLSSKWLAEHRNEYTADATVSYPGIIIQRGTLKVKGKESAATITYNYFDDGLTQTYIYNQNGAFFYYTDLPIFYIKDNTATNTRDDIEYSFIDAYEEDGYYIEYFKAVNNREARMYFKNGELKKYEIVDYAAGLGINYEYIITSYEVNDKDVKLPALAIDITFFYNILKLFGIV